MRTILFTVLTYFSVSKIIADERIFELNIKTKNKETSVLIGEKKMELQLDGLSKWACDFDSERSRDNVRMATGHIDCTFFLENEAILISNAIACPRWIPFSHDFGLAPTDTMAALFFSMTSRKIILGDDLAGPLEINLRCQIPVQGNQKK